ncbi:MAG: aminotransferase class V-fold PLP-dependent enzyme [Magnetospirillum sp.]|nr:aminotransferase class V-fold PLP-dependent enzyme [Magnetospirillum sp.]
MTFGERAVEVVKARKGKNQSWFLDFSLLLGYWGGGTKRAYHHTAPINALYGLHESLVILHEEGLEAAWARHARMHDALKAGLEAMGLSFLVAPAHRLPQLNLVTVPAGVDEAVVRARLLERFGLEIGAGLGVLAGKVWRIGLMGASATPTHVTLCLTALESVLAEMGAPIQAGAALPAAGKVLWG